MKVCDEFQIDVYAYLDGEMEPSMREHYGRHLKNCEVCLAVLDECALIEKEIQEGILLTEVDPPVDGWVKFQQRLGADQDLSLDIELPKIVLFDRISHHFRRQFSVYGLAVAASLALYFSGSVPEELYGVPPDLAKWVHIPDGAENLTRITAQNQEFNTDWDNDEALESYSLARLSDGSSQKIATEVLLEEDSSVPFLETIKIQESDLSRMISIPEGKAFLSDGTSQAVAAFQIDKFPVTNLEYGKFVESTGHRSPFHWSTDSYKMVDSTGLYPVTHVSWEDARAFCSWENKSLLTQGQWIRAARGDSDSKFPWGNEFDPALANTKSSGLGLIPVGQIPLNLSPFGVSEMAGNISEWIEDSYHGESVRGLATEGQFRLMKGGSFLEPEPMSEVGAFTFGEKDTLYGNGGIRCASGL